MCHIRNETDTFLQRKKTRKKIDKIKHLLIVLFIRI